MAKAVQEIRPISLLSSVSDDLLREVSVTCGNEGKMSDKALLALHSIYGNTLERALDLLEKDCVTVLKDANGSRSIIQIYGSVGTLYTLFPQVNYCPCPAYRYHVVGTRSDVTCKHVLAAFLAIALGRCSQRQLPGKELSELLLRSLCGNAYS